MLSCQSKSGIELQLLSNDQWFTKRGGGSSKCVITVSNETGQCFVHVNLIQYSEKALHRQSTLPCVCVTSSLIEIVSLILRA